MSADGTRTTAPEGPSPLAGQNAPLNKKQRRQIAWITFGAIALFVVVRQLPTGTNLSHGDFRVSGGTSIEFCDPANPQFIPVVAVRSPVSTALVSDTVPTEGRPSRFTLTLKTASGKPIGPEDLLVAHTQKLHLMIADPTLEDYQHIHPTPAGPGEWAFTLTPRLSGNYRVFADFTPVATARGLYASAEVAVKPASVSDDSAARAESRLAAPRNGSEFAVYEKNGYIFTLTPAVAPVRARKLADLTFSIVRRDGGAVPLQPVMDAYAHLVAFDDQRSGFAHLHPKEINLNVPPNATRPVLTFKITIPQAGRYVIWAQVNIGGTEVFAPFWFNVGS